MAVAQSLQWAAFIAVVSEKGQRSCSCRLIRRQTLDRALLRLRRPAPLHTSLVCQHVAIYHHTYHVMSQLPDPYDVAVLVLTLVSLLVLSPLILLDKLVQRLILAVRPPVAPAVHPTSFTPLPATLISPPLSVAYTHHFVTTPSSRVHYVLTRPASTASSSSSASSPDTPPPVVFVHGFPDSWYVWRHQLVHFAAARQCIALDMRGFGYSEVAGDKDDAAQYSIARQCGDIAAVLDKEGIDKCFLVGFDWGGMVVWHFSRRYPTRLSGVASLCTPYRPRREWRFPLHVTVRLAPNWLYQLYFAYCRLQAAQEMQSDPDRFFSLAVRSSRQSDKLSPLTVLTTLVAWPFFPLHVPRSALLTAEEQRHMVAMFEWSGYRYPLLWYANHVRNSRESNRTNAELGLPAAASTTASTTTASSITPTTTQLSERIDVPALMLVADSDNILQPVLSEGMEAWCGQLTKVTIRNAGHWAQLEQAEQVNEALERWMAVLATSGATK